MSALGLDDRNNAGGITSYAPRRARRGDSETTIRPVLERLSRGEGREPGPRLVRRAVVHHLPPPDVETVAKSSVPMIARLTIAAGVLAAAAAGALVFMPHSASNPSDAAATPAAAAPAAPKVDMAATPASTPRTVQTLAIRKADDAAPGMASIVKDDARMPQPSASTASVDPVAAPLALWTILPGDTASAAPPSATAALDQAPAQPEAAKPEAAAPAHKSVVRHHARHIVRHSRHHTRHVAHAAPAPAQPAETEQAQPQPVKKLPLQAAIDRLVGGSATQSTPAPQQ